MSVSNFRRQRFKTFVYDLKRLMQVSLFLCFVSDLFHIIFPLLLHSVSSKLLFQFRIINSSLSWQFCKLVSKLQLLNLAVLLIWRFLQALNYFLFPQLCLESIYCTYVQYDSIRFFSKDQRDIILYMLNFWGRKMENFDTSRITRSSIMVK